MSYSKTFQQIHTAFYRIPKVEQLTFNLDNSTLYILWNNRGGQWVQVRMLDAANHGWALHLLAGSYSLKQFLHGYGQDVKEGLTKNIFMGINYHSMLNAEMWRRMIGVEVARFRSGA